MILGPQQITTRVHGQPNNYREKMAAYGVHDSSALAKLEQGSLVEVKTKDGDIGVEKVNGGDMGNTMAKKE